MASTFLMYYMNFVSNMIIVYFADALVKFDRTAQLKNPFPSDTAVRIISNDRFLIVYSTKTAHFYDFATKAWRFELPAAHGEGHFVNIKLMGSHFVAQVINGGKTSYSVYSLLINNYACLINTYDTEVTVINGREYAVEEQTDSGLIGRVHVSVNTGVKSAFKIGSLVTEFLASVHLLSDTDRQHLISLDQSIIVPCDLSRCFQFTNMMAAPGHYDLSALMQEVVDPVMRGMPCIPTGYRVWARAY